MALAVTWRNTSPMAIGLACPFCFGSAIADRKDATKTTSMLSKSNIDYPIEWSYKDDLVCTKLNTVKSLAGLLPSSVFRSLRC